MKKLETIKLQGKDYVQVHTRVEAFHEMYENGRITTKPTFTDGAVFFKATVVLDVKTPDRYFTGHSFGSTKGQKAVEKLETVAVGRALAFMGIGLQQGIASADEMKDAKPKKEQMMGAATGAEISKLMKFLNVDIPEYEKMMKKKIIELTANDAKDIIKNLKALMSPEQKKEYEAKAFL